MKRLLLLTVVFICTYLGKTNAQVLINEFMQSNVDCIMDDLNEFPDSWVELYNAGSSTVDLSGYSLGTSRKANKASKLPKTQIPANGFIVIYCDKEETKDGKHTSFRLESGKDCAIYLFSGTEIVDSIPSGLKKQPAPNIAYGRKTDGADKWGYQLTPTPNAKNCGNVVDAKKILGDPVFSVNGKVVTTNGTQTVELSLPEGAPEGAEIRYTISDDSKKDCPEPTKSSTLYTDAISFSKTTIIRAKVFCDGYLSPRSVTQSYIYFPRNLTLPVVSIATDKKYLHDSKIGILSSSKTTLNGTNQENYKYNWRRPINIEFFEAEDKESVINQLGEARVTGGASRDAALKSLGVYANKRFGEKRLDYEFFPDQRPGITDFKSVMLRNAGNDFDYLYMRDAVIQRIMSENVYIDWQAWRPAIVYQNGEYKGILNIRERSNEDNIYTNYNGLEDIDMIENWWELKEGSDKSWKEFQAFYNEHNHTWDEYNQYLDVQEFMNVMILNLFFNNLDFPGNNIVFWRPQEEGGRWRVIVKDTDFGLGLYDRSVDYKIFEWLYNNNYDAGNAWANKSEHTRLFRRLMEDETFNREFIDRCAIYMGDFMNYNRTWEIWEPMYNLVKYEYPNHRKLFNQWWPNYNDELSKAKNWLKGRVDKFYNQINAYYHVGSPLMLSINGSVPPADLEKISVSFNGVKLSRGTFAGKFFEGRDVTLEGEGVTGWKVIETGTTGTVKTTDVSGSTYTFKMPSCKSVNIVAVLGTSGIDQIATYSVLEDNIVEIYDAAGVRRSHLEKGYNIIRTSDVTTKKIWY